MKKFLGFLEVAFQRILVPTLYLVAMWLSLVTAVSLITEDVYKGLGSVSAVTLYFIIRHHFYKDFFTKIS